jgi:hypothetical protein
VASAARLFPPDLVISLEPDDRTVDAVGYCLGALAQPSPTAREPMLLLTSRLVAGAVERTGSGAGELIELRVWTRGPTARVELHGPQQLLGWPLLASGGEEALGLLDALAERWAVEPAGGSVRVWFEIDTPRTKGRPAHHATPAWQLAHGGPPRRRGCAAGAHGPSSTGDQAAGSRPTRGPRPPSRRRG